LRRQAARAPSSEANAFAPADMREFINAVRASRSLHRRRLEPPDAPRLSGGCLNRADRRAVWSGTISVCC